MATNKATHRSAPGDRSRFRAAERLLQSAARMVAIERAVATLDPEGAPSARAFTGAGALTHATRIGLFSGSFNPLTRAHVAVADAARAQAGLDVLVWAEALVTVDKERVARAALPDRVAQLVAFARPRGGAVLVHNRGLYAEQAEIMRGIVGGRVRLFIVVGFDKVVQIFDPRYYADRDAALAALFAAADLLVAPRPVAGAAGLAALLAQPENQPYREHVLPLDIPAAYLGDSSTHVRDLAATPDAHRAELERLAPPEALALIATQAYAPTEWYALRLAWLAALLPLSGAILGRLPPLAKLVSRVAAPDAAAARTALLDAQRAPSPAAVLALLHALGALPPGVA